MITQAEAKMKAASLVLYAWQLKGREILARDVKARDLSAIEAEVIAIEQWLRRRVLGGDKIAIRQVEKELGRQVKMKGKAR